jgi:hypothetical protein
MDADGYRHSNRNSHVQGTSGRRREGPLQEPRASKLAAAQDGAFRASGSRICSTYFFVSTMTAPPFSLHSFSLLVSSHPLPLQAFWPLQAF